MTSDQLVDNAYLTVISRIAMIAATAILPVAGWLLIRGVNVVDDISRQTSEIHDRVLETSGNIKMIQQSQALQAQILADHEARMRLLEKMQKPN